MQNFPGSISSRMLPLLPALRLLPCALPCLALQASARGRSRECTQWPTLRTDAEGGAKIVFLPLPNASVLADIALASTLCPVNGRKALHGDFRLAVQLLAQRTGPSLPCASRRGPLLCILVRPTRIHRRRHPSRGRRRAPQRKHPRAAGATSRLGQAGASPCAAGGLHHHPGRGDAVGGATMARSTRLCLVGLSGHCRPWRPCRGRPRSRPDALCAASSIGAVHQSAATWSRPVGDSLGCSRSGAHAIAAARTPS